MAEERTRSSHEIVLLKSSTHPAMPRESKAARTTRTQALTARLRAAYPDAHCELNFSSPLELLVATILSAQCTDKQVNVVTADLFKKYRTAADYASAPMGQLESDVRRIGLYRNKARNIQAACRTIVAEHGGEVPRTLEDLVRLAGVGRKTANVVLGHALGVPGLPVDRHVLRVANRIGLAHGDDPVKVETQLCEQLPPKRWTRASDDLILHGRRICKPKPNCPICNVRNDCDFFMSGVVTKPKGRLKPDATSEQKKARR